MREGGDPRQQRLLVLASRQMKEKELGARPDPGDQAPYLGPTQQLWMSLF